MKAAVTNAIAPRLRAFGTCCVATLLAWGGLASTTASSARADTGEPSDEELEALPLEELMQVPTISVMKAETTADEASAIVSVITRNEIVTWGYRSVAEALAHVPGFYGVDDFVAQNFGVRGIGGGQRAYNRVIKVLVNGQPTTFRPDGTNFLGIEYIPMEAIERIEVVRGPASALYGANAYLGVVNVVTRTPQAGHHAEFAVTGQGGAEVGANGRFLVQHAAQNWSMLGAAGYGYFDRSGYSLPSSSPRLDTFTDRTSARDIARPLSVFTLVEYRVSPKTTLRFQTHYSRLDTFAEFLGFGTLSHDNRIAQQNLVNRAKLDADVLEWLKTTASVAFSVGGPAGTERLSDGSTSTRPRRDFAYRALDLVLESTVKYHRYSLLTGVDYTRDAERPLTGLIESTADGSTTAPLGMQSDVVFNNLGVYGQGLGRPFAALPGLGLSANLRYDHHNIYGGAVSYHLGISQQFRSTVTLKLLSGSSFQAPNAYHLYAQPLYSGDFVQNSKLRSEKATTSEAQIILHPHPTLAVSTNAYYTRTKDRIELFSMGFRNLQPRNTGTASALGVELETRWLPGPHQFTAILQAQKTTERVDDPFLGEVAEPAASYPRYMGELAWAFRTGVLGTVGVRGRYVSARRASRANILETNASYLLDPYATIGLAWTYEWTRSRLQFFANNLLGASYAEPGYGGIDIPGRKRELLATFTWMI